jgi:DNA-binding response OmpR family regulator
VSSGLDGVRVLLVDDSSGIVFGVEAMLEELGCTLAGAAASLAEARALSATVAYDVALLDVGLGGETVFPFAEELLKAGRMFIFATGQNRAVVPHELRAHPIIMKPYDVADLSRALEMALKQAS